MKVRVVHRDPEEFDPANRKPTVGHRMLKNADPTLHPLEKARELQRALVATKMEKMFSKPLIGVLDGHRDAVRCMSRCHRRLVDLFTGSCDGDIRHWNIAKKTCIRSIRAHEGFIRGLVLSHDDEYVFSCGDDGIVKQWEVPSLQQISEMDMEAAEDGGNLVRLGEVDVNALATSILPVKIWNANGPLTSIDHHWIDPTFLTTGETVDIWDRLRSSPIHSFDWSSNAVYTARFNPAEHNLIGASGADNVVGLFDLRTSSSIQKVFMKLRTNALCWNPMSPLNFTIANEDHNLYTFDMRKLEAAIMVHKDFTAPVLDVDYSPTGREFVAGSYDRTIRIFKTDSARSREIYHGRRMQIVLAVRYSADSRFVLSGSADFCVRIWKNKAWEALGPRSYREKRVLAYREALKNRYKYVPEIRRILNHHHVPKFVKKTSEKHRIMADAERRKQMNRELHSAPGSVKKIPERKKAIKKVTT